MKSVKGSVCSHLVKCAELSATMNTRIFTAVGEILHEAARTTVLPRFAAFKSGESEMKAPGEPVTIADREAEAQIGNALMGLIPGARIIGEEACAANQGLLSDLDSGIAWIIDPIDGTANFVAGRAPFAMMIALLVRGETIGAWVYAPLTGCLTIAERGGGAWSNGERVLADGTEVALASLRGIISSAFLPIEYSAQADRVRAAVLAVDPTARCAGHEYPLVARGERDFALYWRTLVWDHAPGALILDEAGGAVTYLDGSRYDPTTEKTGLLLAHTPQISAMLLEQFMTP